MIQAGIEQFGQVDILVNNAGVSAGIARLHGDIRRPVSIAWGGRRRAVER